MFRTFESVSDFGLRFRTACLRASASSAAWARDSTTAAKRPARGERPAWDTPTAIEHSLQFKQRSWRTCRYSEPFINRQPTTHLPQAMHSPSSIVYSKYRTPPCFSMYLRVMAPVGQSWFSAPVSSTVLRGEVARAVVAVAAQGEAVHRLDGRQVEHAVRLAAAAGDAAIGVDLPDLRQAAARGLAALAAGGVGTRTSGGRLARSLAEQPGGKRADAAQGRVAGGVAHHPAARDRRFARSALMIVLPVSFVAGILFEDADLCRPAVEHQHAAVAVGGQVGGRVGQLRGPATTVWNFRRRE